MKNAWKQLVTAVHENSADEANACRRVTSHHRFFHISGSDFISRSNHGSPPHEKKQPGLIWIISKKLVSH
ncbi:hypothetical protein BH688_02375 [Kushneria phosphatilytica]|nr:hypothetical protein BH688_02375 [Kushneria phosphatilytica]